MLKGGKVVGKGTYGCVYNPPMKCMGSGEREPNTISKLMDYKEALKEVKEMSVIDNIDPDYEFHVELSKICDPGIPIQGVDYKVKDGEIVNSCPMIESVLKTKTMSGKLAELKEKNLKLVKYEDGGTNLAVFIGDKIGQLTDDSQRSDFFLKLFLSMENLFKGLVVMERHDFCHFDIKLENIVIREQSDSEKLFTLKYIDFGMSRNFDEIPSRNVFNNAYFAWPLELMLFKQELYNAVDTDATKQTMLDAFSRSFASKVARQTIDTRTMDPYTMTINDANIFQKYIYDINGTPGVNKSEMYHEMTSKIDVFSLGIVLLESWANILQVFFYNREATDVLLDSFTHREIFDEIHELILNMIRPYYGTRYTAEQAYNEFMSIKQLILQEDDIKPIRTTEIPGLVGAQKTRLTSGSPNIEDLVQPTRLKSKTGKRFNAMKTKKRGKKVKTNIPGTRRRGKVTFAEALEKPPSKLSSPKIDTKPGKSTLKSEFTFGDYKTPLDKDGLIPFEETQKPQKNLSYMDFLSGFAKGSSGSGTTKTEDSDLVTYGNLEEDVESSSNSMGDTKAGMSEDTPPIQKPVKIAQRTKQYKRDKKSDKYGKSQKPSEFLTSQLATDPLAFLKKQGIHMKSMPSVV
jgi:serine/threonine protein kinase